MVSAVPISSMRGEITEQVHSPRAAPQSIGNFPLSSGSVPIDNSSALKRGMGWGVSVNIISRYFTHCRLYSRPSTREETTRSLTQNQGGSGHMTFSYQMYYLPDRNALSTNPRSRGESPELWMATPFRISLPSCGSSASSAALMRYCITTCHKPIAFPDEASNSRVASCKETTRLVQTLNR